jgi:hypothetical protein
MPKPADDDLAQLDALFSPPNRRFLIKVAEVFAGSSLVGLAMEHLL